MAARESSSGLTGGRVTESDAHVRSAPEAHHMTSLKGVHRSPHQGPGQSRPSIEAHQARLRAVAKRPRLGISVTSPEAVSNLKVVAPCIS